MEHETMGVEHGSVKGIWIRNRVAKGVHHIMWARDIHCAGLTALSTT
jgi:hypothetical protein